MERPQIGRSLARLSNFASATDSRRGYSLSLESKDRGESQSSSPDSKPFSSSRASIPKAAFTDTTGLSPSTIRIGKVSTQSAGLFTGAIVGTQAYADYITSQGGVHGRKLMVDTLDDQFTGAGNKQQTQTGMANDFALVGSFSFEDSFGETVVAQNSQVPYVSMLLAPGWACSPFTVRAHV